MVAIGSACALRAWRCCCLPPSLQVLRPRITWPALSPRRSQAGSNFPARSFAFMPSSPPFGCCCSGTGVAGRRAPRPPASPPGSHRFSARLRAGADTLARKVPFGLAELLYIVNLTMVAVFAVLMAFAYQQRNMPAAYKRLILIANIALAFAPFIRIPAPLLYLNIPNATRASYLFLLPVVLYDLWSVRRIHPATLWSSVFLVVTYEARTPIAGTAAWHEFAAWVRSMS